MALADLSFKLYTDSGLTTLFNGLLQLTHETDLSDNPQDTTLYFGSNTASRSLEAVSNPGVDNITITPTDSLAEWVTLTAYTTADAVQPTTANGKVYDCTTAGTTAASEPTFPTGAIGDTVVDGTVVWTLRGVKHEETEIKLATTSGGLATATAGAALSLGVTLTSGVGNLTELHIRVTNAVATVSDNTGNPAIGLNINNVQET